MQALIKVGFLVSYDYDLLKNSLPLIYADADVIVIAIDKNRRTWGNNAFNLSDSFFEWLDGIDEDKKIKIYEDNFYLPELNPMENETRERNLLAKFMGEGGWHVQLDTDEYFINFAGFANFLKSKIDNVLSYPDEPVCIYGKLITLFKETANGYLYIDNQENAPIATMHPQYETARFNGKRKLLTNFFIVHQSWARGDEEILTKLGNWSHKNDFNTHSYYNFWKACDEYNYRLYNNFHPLYPELWQKLEFIKQKNITNFISSYIQLNKKKINDKQFQSLKRIKRSVFDKVWGSIKKK